MPAYAAGDKGVQVAAKSGVWWELVKLMLIELAEWFIPPMVSMDAMKRDEEMSEGRKRRVEVEMEMEHRIGNEHILAKQLVLVLVCLLLPTID